MTAGAILFAIITGLAANECCELAPWCARKLVRWSAFLRYPDPARAEARAEELAAVINDRPGNLLKLITALTFAGGAALVSTHRSIARHSETAQSEQKAGTDAGPGRIVIDHAVMENLAVLDTVYSYLDGGLNDTDSAKFRVDWDWDYYGPYLREYGLEEAVKRLLHKHCGHDAVPGELRTKVLNRITVVRQLLTASEFATPQDNDRTN